MPLLPTYDSLNWNEHMESDLNKVQLQTSSFKHIFSDINMDIESPAITHSNTEDKNIFPNIISTYVETVSNGLMYLSNDRKKSMEYTRNVIDKLIEKNYNISTIVIKISLLFEDNLGNMINAESFVNSFKIYEDNYKKYSIINFINLFPLFQSYNIFKRLNEIGYPRPMIYTYNSYIGSGQFSGVSIDNKHNSFSDMKQSLIQSIKMNILGNPHVLNEVNCNGESNKGNYIDEELCIRWIQMICLFPHVGVKNFIHVLTNLKQIESFAIINNTLNIRQMFSMYLYSYFLKMSLEGGSLIRPLFLDFKSKDHKNTLFELDDQYMVGSALMLNPVFGYDITSKSTFFPSDKFYDFYTGYLLNTNEGFFKMNVPLYRPAIYVRGGYIIPIQNYKIRTNKNLNINQNISLESTYDISIIKNYPIDLIVALDHNFRANGYVMFDDSKSILTKNDLFSQKLINKLEITATNINNVFSIIFHIDSKNKISSNKNYTINNIYLFGFTALSVKKITIINKEGRRELIKDFYDFDNSNDLLILTDLQIVDFENKITIVL